MIELNTDHEFLIKLSDDLGDSETARDIRIAAQDIKNLTDYIERLEWNINQMSSEINSIRQIVLTLNQLLHEWRNRPQRDEAGDWVKALGQWHLSDPSAPVTRCGAPMLGNNYARHIPAEDRQKCPLCWGTGPDRI